MDRAINRSSLGGSISPLLQNSLLLIAVVQLPLGLWAALDDTGRGAMIWVGTACLLATGFPMLVRGPRLNALEPIVWCTVAVGLGATLRTIYIAYSSYYRADFLMFGQTYWEVAVNGFWVLIALSCMALGYASTTGRFKIERWRAIFERQYDIDARFYFVSAISILLVIVSCVIFIRQFDISLELDSISKKRHLAIVDAEGETVYSSLGYVRVLSVFAEISIYFMLAVVLIYRKRVSSSNVLFIFLLFISACALPFISSSRAQIAMVLLNGLALGYLAGRIKLSYIIPAVLFLGAMVTIMEDLRSEGRRVAEGGTVIDSVIGSGNFFDLARTTAIMERMPEQADYLYGKSYIALISAPIPRTIWPEKPIVSLGPWVKSEVFGNRTVSTGWPSNIIGEAAINFGVIGMIFVGFLYGVFIRYVFNTFEPFLGRHVAPTVIYVCIFWPLGIQLFSSNFAKGISDISQIALPALIFILVAARGRMARRVGGRLAGA